MFAQPVEVPLIPPPRRRTSWEGQCDPYVPVPASDGRSIPKVIDFGVAKAIDQRLTQETLFTEQGQLIGTPAYMSPEQAELSVHDVDTRTDIYSLGVLLYELLAGVPPFDPGSLRQAAFDEIRHIIRDVDPPKPSTKLSSLSVGSAVRTSYTEPPASAGADRERGKSARAKACGSVADIACNRQVDPRALTRRLRGDLDWITMKALEKDRGRRYATASDFATDICRHLDHEPVLARPPSAAYRVSKFVRRNKTLFGSMVAVFVVLVGGVTVSTRLYVRAEKLRGLAAREAQTARTISDFLVNDMLASVNPQIAQGRKITVEEVLENASERIDTAFFDQPEIEAAVRATIGETYLNLGLYRSAEAHLRVTEAIRERELGDDHPNTILVRSKLVEAVRRQGNYADAETLARQTLGISRRVLGDEHPETLTVMNNLANVLRGRGENEDAERFHRQTLAGRRRALGDEHPDTLMSMNNLGVALQMQNKYSEAEKVHRDTLDARCRVLGEMHPDTLMSMHNLGLVLVQQGKHVEAEPVWRLTLERCRSVLGDEHPYTADALHSLGHVLEHKGDMAGAESAYRESLRLARGLGDRHPRVAQISGCLINLLRAQGKYEETRPFVAARIVDLGEAAQQPGAGADAVNAYAWMLLTCEPADLRDPQAALMVAQRAVKLSESRDPGCLDTLALAYQMTDNLHKAIEAQKKAVGLLPPAESSLRAELETRLVDFLSEQGDFASAEQVLIEGYDRKRLKSEGGSDQIQGTVEQIVKLYEVWGKPEQAAKWRTKLSKLNGAEPSTP